MQFGRKIKTVSDCITIFLIIKEVAANELHKTSFLLIKARKMNIQQYHLAKHKGIGG